MGTANSYGGSGGAWNGAGDELIDWLDSLPDAPSTDADVQSDNEVVPTSGVDAARPAGSTSLSPGLAAVLRGVSRGLRGAAGAGGGGVGGGGGSRPASSGSTGGRRSSAAAGTVGGRAAAGVAAFRSGNTAELEALGLDPGELAALDSDYKRAARIAEAAAESAPTSIQDEELRRAAAATAIWGLTQVDAPDAIDLVRQFVEEYLYRVITVELGARLRDGRADGESSLPAEQTLRSTIRGMIRNLPVAATGDGHVDLGRAIETTYDLILGIWAAE